MAIETERMVLRAWQMSDREEFARLNSDIRVMEFMPACLSTAESDLFFDRIQRHFQKYGFGLYVAELSEARRFAGTVGLMVPQFEAHFTPCVEIGWRLTADCWGRGLATEGARAVVRHAFESLNLESLVSFTVQANVSSRRVMAKIGMTRDSADDFEHPDLPEGHPLRPHVLYRLSRTDWMRARQ